jgi:hypothetical protein
MSSIIAILSSPIALTTYKVVYYTAPIWVTFGLASILFHVWMIRGRAKFIEKQKYTLLEIKIPKEIFKSPAAMEFLFNVLWMPFGETKWDIKWDRWPPKFTYDYWKGAVRNWFSLEICAIGGKVHFFIWTRSGNKALIEAQLYSQYPGIEIYEVPDYTLPVSYNPETMSMWCSEFVLNKADCFPIKTYVDYGMDKDPKDEYRLDPLLPLIEFIGALSPEHQVWIQIVITSHKATDKVKDPKTGKVDMQDLKWKKAAEEAIQKIHDKAKPPKPKEGEVVQNAPRSMTDGEKDTIKALERSVGKKGFDTGIRAIYFAPKEIFSPANGGGVSAGLGHFNTDLNGFKGRKVVDLDSEKTHILYAYKNRGYFYNEFETPNFVLNTEELATIFHLPAGITTSPAFDRIGSKKAQAPSNLPQ